MRERKNGWKPRWTIPEFSREAWEVLRVAGGIAGGYMLVSGLWILLSDRAVGFFATDPALITALSTYKGFLFVAVTGGLLFVLIYSWGVRLRKMHLAAVLDMQKVQALIENANILILRWTDEGRVAFLNEYGLRYFGVGREDIAGRPVMGAIFPESERAAFEPRQLIAAIRLHPKETCYTTVECVRRDGEKAWIAWTHTILPEDTFQLPGILSIGTDITERKRAEEALRQSEATLRSVFGAAPVGICLMKDRVYTSANKYWCEKFGYPEASIVGKTTRMLYESDAEWERAGRALYDDLASKGLSSTETRLRRSDGVLRDVVIIAAPIQQDDLSEGTVVIIHDITERKATERALHENELKFRTLFETAGDAIFLMHDERFVDCNARTLAMFGCGRDQILGARPSDFSPPVQPSGVVSEEAAMEKIARALLGTPQFFEWVHCRWDNVPFPAEVTLNRLELGGEVYLQALVRDISERKRAEEELRKWNVELERRVEERTAELVSAKERAESADRLKSTFLAAMSHELRTPLNSIIGFTGIVLQELPGPLNPEQAKQLGMVRNSARHLLALINDVLDLSKIEAGQLEVEMLPFDARASVERVAHLLAPLAARKGLALETEVAPGVGEWMGDARRFEQILINLANNGLKFTESGTVRIVCSTDGRVLTTRVSDTGIGIKAEEMDRIFEAFHQIEEGLTRNHEGTGLGLSICKRLVEKMGGAIRVESVWGTGSVFSFSLPAGDAKDMGHE